MIAMSFLHEAKRYSYKYWRAIYPLNFHRCINPKCTENLSKSYCLPAWIYSMLGSGYHLFKQHFLYFFPLPHGHGSFRPIVGSVFTIVKFSICFIFGRFSPKDLGFSIYSSSVKYPHVGRAQYRI